LDTPSYSGKFDRSKSYEVTLVPVPLHWRESGILRIEN